MSARKTKTKPAKVVDGVIDEKAAQARKHRLRGILLMTGACAFFSCIDATGKYLNLHMDTLQVVWSRYTFAFLLALIVVNPIRNPGMLRTKRPWLQAGRALLLLMSTFLNFTALRYLQLDQALAILFSAPFIIAILSGPLLGEWVGWRRWLAIIVGFCGVLIIIRPGIGGLHPAAFLSVIGACCYALYNVSTRFLSGYDSNETTLFYSNFYGVLVMTPMMPFVWVNPDTPLTFSLMIALGLFGSVGHFMLIVAHRKAPASVLSPFIYTQIAGTAALGYLVFSQLPDRWTILGAAIIIVSGLYMIHRERVRRV